MIDVGLFFGTRYRICVKCKPPQLVSTYLVCGERSRIAGNGHVDKVLLVAQMPERGQDRRLEVVPLEGVLLLRGRR